MEHILSKTILISQTIELIAKKYKLSDEEVRKAKDIFKSYTFFSICQTIRFS